MQWGTFIMIGATLALLFGGTAVKKLMPTPSAQPTGILVVRSPVPVPTVTPTFLPTPSPQLSPTPSPSSPPPVPSPTSLKRPEVPFVVQAQGTQWSDPIYQDGCEEASALMVSRWLTGDTIAPEEAPQQIRLLAAEAKKLFGTARDSSAEDTAKLLYAIVEDADVTVKHDINARDLRAALAEGHVLMVPVDGRKLSNPFYTPPGPDRHMLVVWGFDEETDEFLTHDPGTKNGKGWRYDRGVLEQALRDYPTGDHLPIAGARRVMIVVHSQE